MLHHSQTQHNNHITIFLNAGYHNPRLLRMPKNGGDFVFVFLLFSQRGGARPEAQPPIRKTCAVECSITPQSQDTAHILTNKWMDIFLFYRWIDNWSYSADQIQLSGAKQQQQEKIRKDKSHRQIRTSDLMEKSISFTKLTKREKKERKKEKIEQKK